MAAIYVELGTTLHTGMSLIPESNDLMTPDQEKKQQIQHLASMKRHSKIECSTKCVGCGCMDWPFRDPAFHLQLFSD